MVEKYGLQLVNFYMEQVKINAEKSIKAVLSKLNNGSYETLMDNGSKINLKNTINKKQQKAVFDFTGSSYQTSNNFNAPKAVTKSAILYVLRTLVNKKIPLNDGCLNPIKIIIPDNSILNPKFPAAVVAGNVETSQTIVDTINCALKVQAACYGTMSNFTFGNNNFGYYETICGGEGASNNHNGADAIQCHMTNTRLTDQEILNAYKILAKEGVFCEPASAASVAGLIKNRNRIQKESTIVCVLTGNGLKDPDCAIKNNEAIFRKNIEPSLKNITKILGY